MIVLVIGYSFPLFASTIPLTLQLRTLTPGGIVGCCPASGLVLHPGHDVSLYGLAALYSQI